MYRRIDESEVIDYSDSDFTGCVDFQKSTSGYIFMFASEAVSWRSAKQTLTATSIMEAEFVSFFFRLPHIVYGLRVSLLGLELWILYQGH